MLSHSIFTLQTIHSNFCLIDLTELIQTDEDYPQSPQDNDGDDDGDEEEKDGDHVEIEEDENCKISFQLSADLVISSFLKCWQLIDTAESKNNLSEAGKVMDSLIASICRFIIVLLCWFDWSYSIMLIIAQHDTLVFNKLGQTEHWSMNSAIL